MGIQIKLPEGKTPDNWYNVTRDIAHVLDKIVRQVVLALPADAVVPAPTVTECENICQVFLDLFTDTTNPKMSIDEVVNHLDRLPPAFRAAFERALTLNMFKRFVQGKRDISGTPKPVEPDVIE